MAYRSRFAHLQLYNEVPAGESKQSRVSSRKRVKYSAGFYLFMYFIFSSFADYYWKNNMDVIEVGELFNN